MTAVPDNQVAKLLPHDAVAVLRAAAASESVRAIARAEKQVKQKYPQFFKQEK